MKNLKKIFKTILSDFWIYKFNFVLAFFFLWLSPVILLMWLVIFTVFLACFKKLTKQSFIKTWIPVLIFWYSILLVDLLIYSPVIVGPECNIENLFIKILMGKVYFERICFSTIMLSHELGHRLGFSIIIIPVLNEWVIGVLLIFLIAITMNYQKIK